MNRTVCFKHSNSHVFAVESDIIPIAEAISSQLPAGVVFQLLFVATVNESVIVHRRKYKARIRFHVATGGRNESFLEPAMPDIAGIRAGIDSRSPVRF